MDVHPPLIRHVDDVPRMCQGCPDHLVSNSQLDEIGVEAQKAVHEPVDDCWEETPDMLDGLLLVCELDVGELEELAEW